MINKGAQKTKKSPNRKIEAFCIELKKIIFSFLLQELLQLLQPLEQLS